jgi:hypothetical protein
MKKINTYCADNWRIFNTFVNKNIQNWRWIFESANIITEKDFLDIWEWWKQEENMDNLTGWIELWPNYSCPYCWNRSIVKCGNCENLYCRNWTDKSVTCGNCFHTGVLWWWYIEDFKAKSTNALWWGTNYYLN